MNCYVCKSRLMSRETTFMVDLEPCMVIVKNVPSFVCIQCGHISYSDVVAKRLAALVETVKNSAASVLVLDYLKQVA